jgi:hypothetical protein
LLHKTSEPRFTGFKDFQDNSVYSGQISHSTFKYGDKTMRKSLISARAAFVRPLLAAAFGLALVFTFSCSSDGSDSNSSLAPSINDNNPGPVESVSKFQAKQASEVGNKKIKYMYSYGDYDFYYIYLGELKNIPLFGYPTEYHDGTKTTYTVSNAQTVKESVAETIANSSQTAIGVVEEHTYSTNNQQKVSAEIKASTGWGPAKAEAKAAAEASWEQYTYDNKTTSFHETTSLTNTITNGTEHTKTTLISRSWELGKDNKVGYYKYTLFSASDVYLYVIKDATGVIYYEFREHVIPDVYFWRFDYSETPSFRKSDATSFEFDVSILDNLPKPDILLSLVLPPPPSPSLTLVEKTETVEYTTVDERSYTFDKNYPGTEATIDVWVLGGGGGGQGGHRWQCGLWACDGTGGGGGGGAAAYVNFKVKEPITFSTIVGSGGYAGSEGTAKSGGGHGGTGGDSRVTASGDKAFVLTAGGGGGGGTTSSGCQNPSGDNSQNYGCGAGGSASQSGISTATLKNGSYGTLGSESDNAPVGGTGGSGGNAEGYSGGAGGIGGYGTSGTGDKRRSSAAGGTGRVRIVIKYQTIKEN